MQQLNQSCEAHKDSRLISGQCNARRRLEGMRAVQDELARLQPGTDNVGPILVTFWGENNAKGAQVELIIAEHSQHPLRV